MHKLAVLLLLLPRLVCAQMDLPGDDTLKKLPLFEMTNRGITRIDFYQGAVCFVIINSQDSSVAFDYSSSYKDIEPDTVYLQKSELFNPHQIDDFDVMNSCEYRDGKKSGKEYGFYSFDEMDSVLVTGWNFRLKFSGQWKDGKKDGKWYYYSKNGELIGIETWKKGTLISAPVLH